MPSRVQRPQRYVTRAYIEPCLAIRTAQLGLLSAIVLTFAFKFPVHTVHVAGTLTCNRTHAEATWLDTTAWPVSCLAILQADPAATSGFYRVQPTGSSTVISVFCDMDMAGGGWTLCGKYDRDGGLSALEPTFGRATIGEMATLPFSGSQASIDCRPFLEGSDGYVLSVGADGFSATGYTGSTVGRVSGPVPAGMTAELFDTTGTCTGASISSITQHFERLDRPSNVGLNRAYWAYNTFGPVANTAGRNYDGSHVSLLGCSNTDECATDVIDSGTPPTATDVLNSSLGMQLPPAWGRYRSYVAKLSGYFVPPFDAEYRFVLEGDNAEKSYLFLSMDHTPADKQELASKKNWADSYGRNDVALTDYRYLRAGRGYYIEVHHANHNSGNDEDKAGKLGIKVCIKRPASGPDYTMPPDVGGANYHFVDNTVGLAPATFYGGSAPNGKGLFDLTCAPGYAS